MYVQTEETPNPNTLKFLPGKTVSEVGSIEFTSKDQTENRLIKDILSVKEVNMVFLGSDFITVKKTDQILWKEIKPKIISLINEYYLKDNDSILDKNYIKQKLNDVIVAAVWDPMAVKQMQKAGINYDQLIMGFGGGDRVLINDRKLNSGRDTAYVINLERDTGIEDVKL